MLRLLTILAATLAIVSAGPLAFDRHGHGGQGGPGGHGGQGGSGGQGGPGGPPSPTAILQYVNTTVQIVTSAISTAATAVPLFDLQPIESRFVELNTSTIRAIWDAKTAFLNNQTNLTWATLPSAVQAALTNMKDNNLFLNLPLSDWGFVSTSDADASKSIYSKLGANCQSLATSIVSLTSGLHFATTVDLTTLQTAFAALHQHPAHRSLDLISRHYGGHFQGQQPQQTPTQHLYAYLSSPTTVRDCFLDDPMHFVNELVQHCQ